MPAEGAVDAATKVAVGVVVRNGRVCISLRPKHLHKGGFWEFPGGKIESGESVEEALRRELVEELGILVEKTRPLTEIRWSYSEKDVLLQVLVVTGFSGEARGLEGQEVRWIGLDELHEYEFPEANAGIVELLVGMG